MHSCNFVYDNGSKCISTYLLHSLYFRDPYSETIPVFVSLCQKHYQVITGELNEHVREYQMKVSNLISQNARNRRTAKEFDTYYDSTMARQKIEDLQALIKKIQNNECRNYFCKADLTKLGQFDRLFSVHTFKPSGRRHYSYYFCSLKCFNIMKGKCGISSMIQRGQTTLSL